MPDQDVKIQIWPKEPAQLEHRFDPEAPCPVSIRFEDSRARVRVETSQERPIHAAMNLNLGTAGEPLRVCVSVCDPICAESDYRIGLTVFDQPAALVSVRGRTKLGPCRPPREDPGKPTKCVDLSQLPADQVLSESFVFDGVTFEPLGASLTRTTLGDPAGQVKLGFPAEGVRIVLPQPSNAVVIRLNNYFGEHLTVATLSASGVRQTHQVPIQNEMKAVPLPGDALTQVEVSGSQNEASVLEICFDPLPPTE